RELGDRPQERRLLPVMAREILAQHEVLAVPVHGPGEEHGARGQTPGLQVQEQGAREPGGGKGAEVGLRLGRLAEAPPMRAASLDLGAEALVDEHRAALVAPLAAWEERFDAHPLRPPAAGDLAPRSTQRCGAAISYQLAEAGPEPLVIQHGSPSRRAG